MQTRSARSHFTLSLVIRTAEKLSVKVPYEKQEKLNII